MQWNSLQNMYQIHLSWWHKTHLKYKSYKISIVNTIRFKCLTILKFYTKHSSITAVLCAKFQNDGKLRNKLWENKILRDLRLRQFLTTISYNVTASFYTELSYNAIWGHCCQKQVSQAGISNYIPQLNVGCNYLSLPEIPASGNKVHTCMYFTGFADITISCMLRIISKGVETWQNHMRAEIWNVSINAGYVMHVHCSLFDCSTW